MPAIAQHRLRTRPPCHRALPPWGWRGYDGRERFEPFAVGQAKIVRQGQGVAFLAFGPLLHEALKVAETMDATVVNMRWAKPLDVQTLTDIALSHDRLVTLEDGTRKGGAGAAVLEALQDLAWPSGYWSSALKTNSRSTATPAY